jgi:hypothetical protein
MGKGSEWIAANRANEDHGPGSCEANYVTGSPQKNCCVPTSEMGENKSPTEGCLVQSAENLTNP